MTSTSIPFLVQELAVYTTSDDNTGQALLGQLREAVWGNAGKTMRGARSVDRTPLVVDAFTLWEDIAGQVEAMFHGATEQRPNRAPEVNLLAWWAVFSAATERGDTTETMHEVALERLDGFATRIRGYFDRPTEIDLDISCPSCGMRRITTGEGEEEVENFAIAVLVRAGDEIVAFCRNPACRDKWIGDTEVIHLGRTAGITLDVDAIRAARAPEVAA